MTSAEELWQRLDAARTRLTRALAGVTEEQFKRRPPATDQEPSPWCMAQLLAHLLATERLWTGRISLALSEDGAAITPSPPEAHEEGARSGRHVPVPLLIHGLLGARYETLRLLERATAADGRLQDRTLWHPRLAETLDLAWMFEKIASHEEGHVLQVGSLREAVGARPLSNAAEAARA